MRRLAVLFSSLFLFGQMQATLHPEPCHFGFEAEALFFRPSYLFQGLGSEIITIAQNDSLFHRRDIRPRYRTGFRVNGALAYDCVHDISLSYTHFHSGSYRRNIPGLVSTSISLFEGINGRVDFRYDAVDGLLNTWVLKVCNFDLNFGAGLHYANIRVREHIDYLVIPFVPGGSATNDYRDRFWGIGPEIAFDFAYRFPACFIGNFSVAGLAKGALLASRLDSRHVRLVNNPEGTNRLTEIADPDWNVTPTADFRLGLAWDYCWTCLKGKIEAGYEWLYYRKVASRSALEYPIHSDISFDGPYLSIGLIF